MTDAHGIPPAGREIRIHGLSKYYGKLCALDDVDLRIKPGEFLTLLGPSGSGKSTVLMTLAGFIEPTRGDIVVGGKSISRLAPEKRDFGIVFQGYALFPHMSVADNVAYPLKARGMKRDEIDRKVSDVLNLVQLGSLADRQPKQLSGGQQQRVALARALVFDPQILLLDEPMGALDKKLRHDLQIELRQLHRRLGRTFLNVTHDQEEAMAMSDRIAIMRNGRVVQVDAPRTLYDLPDTRFVADFLGKSNFVVGKVTAVEGGIAAVDTPDGPVHHALGSKPTAPGEQILLALRPHKIRLGSSISSMKAFVETMIFYGTYAELTVRCRSGQVVAANIPIGNDALPEEGSEVEIGWDPTATVAVRPD